MSSAISSSQKDASKPQWVLDTIQEKAERRRMAWNVRKEKAAELKEKGNEMFQAKDYEGAAAAFEEAATLEWTNTTHWSNYFAACCKLENYEEVIIRVDMPLSLDPKHKKLRYRRMQARRACGFYRGALADAKVILRLSKSQKDPASDANAVQMRKEVKELESLIAARPRRSRTKNQDPFWDQVTDEEDDHPNEEFPGAKDWVPELYWTEEEDGPHEGNGVPCRYYNKQKGCSKGNSCGFSHTVNDFSERDLMGKNVCKYWILGKCKFDAEKCNYAHTDIALLDEGWWTSPEGRLFVATEMEDASRALGKEIRAKKKQSHFVDAMHKEPRTGPIGKKKLPKKGKKSGPSRGSGYPSFGNFADEDSGDDFDGMGLGGNFFSPEDEFDLLCQGVKPWDEDAADVLAVLRGDYY